MLCVSLYISVMLQLGSRRYLISEIKIARPGFKLGPLALQAKKLTTTPRFLLVMTLFVSFSEQTINLNILDADTYRRFCNKIWQSYKFVLNKLGDSFKPTGNIESCDLVDQWIISRLSHMIRSCDKHFKTYNLQKACKELHGFWLLDFCDTYLVSYSFM